MQFTKIPYYAHKLIELGPRRSYAVIERKFLDQLFEKAWRKKVVQGFAAHTWSDVAQRYRLQSVEKVVDTLQQRILPVGILNSDISLADQYQHNIFSLLGSIPQQFLQIPWHTDFRLQQQDPSADVQFDAHSFYKDIQITVGHDPDQLKKDIKVPWELSRLQHLPVLGQTYTQTNDEKYAQKFVADVTDWHNHNPYMCGINWLCPMEVGIRATNLVIAWTLFKDANIDDGFWQQLFCLLYDHLVYLENNWEIYDSRTSNHYLGDLIGYFYLCWFFKDLPGFDKKIEWCHQELLREAEKQILPDGTDYEGSTAYHRLVTEMFYHHSVLAQDLGLVVPIAHVKKLEGMLDFIDWCTPVGGKMVTIGDDDSGSLVDPAVSFHRTDGFVPSSQACLGAQENNKIFPNFGLSVYKDKRFHITLRHHVYNHLQPSGHFHNDVGSITLAVDGKPFFVDPGSFIYTASAHWRNYFRSTQVHNTFSMYGDEQVPFDERLFALAVPISSDPIEHFNMIRIVDTQLGVTAHRQLIFDQKSAQLTIIDEHKMNINNAIVYDGYWNFTLHPAVTISNVDGTLILEHDKTRIKLASIDLIFEIVDGWYASKYGEKVATKNVVAKKKVLMNEQIKIEIVLY